MGGGDDPAEGGLRRRRHLPKGAGAQESYVELGGVHVYRHPLPIEARGALAYPLEYASALFYQAILAWWVFFRHGFDAIHACNPPDTIFLIGGFFKLVFGKKFVFDHHDINPELYVAKFGRKDLAYRSCSGSSAGPFAPPTSRSPQTIPTAALLSSVVACRPSACSWSGRPPGWNGLSTSRRSSICDAAAATSLVISVSSATRRVWIC